MLASPPPKVLRFDVFILDPVRCIALRGDKKLTLRRQAFDVLRFLAEHAGETVPKEQLLAAVWPGIKVTDDSVVQCIKEIRQALGEDARWIIKTITGRGYVFMPEVVAIEEASALSQRSSDSSQTKPAPVGPESHSHADAGQHQWQRALIAAGLLMIVLASSSWLIWWGTRLEPPPVLTMMAVPSLAVLPFEPVGHDEGERHEARVLANELTTEISRHNWGSMLSLKFTAGYHGHAMDRKIIGRETGARYLFAGSLQRTGAHYSGNAALIEAETGRQLWVRPFRYDTPQERRYTVARLASSVAGNIVTTENQRPLPARLEAGHYTLRAFVLLSNQRSAANTKAAQTLLDKALELDRNWAPAWVAYSWARVNEFYGKDSESLSRAEQAIAHAIKLQPANSAAYERRAHLLRVRGDSHGAIAASEHALTLNPNLPQAHAELGRNKIDAGLAHEAIAHIDEAIRLAPAHNSVYLWWWWAGQAALHMGDYNGAVRWLEKARQGNPANTGPVPWLAIAYAGAGRENEGRTLLADYAAKTPGFTVSDWIARHSRRNAVATAQFAPIAETMRRLDVVEGSVQVGSGP